MQRAHELLPVMRDVERSWPIQPLADEVRAKLQIGERFASGIDGPDVRLVVYHPAAATGVLPVAAAG